MTKKGGKKAAKKDEKNMTKKKVEPKKCGKK